MNLFYSYPLTPLELCRYNCKWKRKSPVGLTLLFFRVCTKISCIWSLRPPMKTKCYTLIQLVICSYTRKIQYVPLTIMSQIYHISGIFDIVNMHLMLSPLQLQQHLGHYYHDFIAIPFKPRIYDFGIYYDKGLHKMFDNKYPELCHADCKYSVWFWSS